MEHVIVPLVAGFRQRFPQIELELNTDNLIIDLLEKRTDIAIRIGALRDSTIHARLLGASRLRILASPDYIARFGAPPSVEELNHHSLLGFTQPESLNLWPLRHRQAERFAITPTLSASSGETLRQLALRGEGIAQLADFMTREDQREGRLVQLLAAETLDVRQPINAVYYRNAQFGRADHLFSGLCQRAYHRCTEPVERRCLLPSPQPSPHRERGLVQRRLQGQK
ncbi:D-malate degradation protein R [Serratia fonticola]|uniref:D-malate degradation protein R n=1 Tax=Serratia fonticola TaxID=47917 RepID=A0A4U9W6N3_SERFO|nr:D-malate degradation protein R [Serratia fonticola]